MKFKINHAQRGWLFENYAKYVWPIHRRFVSKHLSERCKKCSLSGKCSPLSQGLCGQCRNQTEPSAEQVDNIEQITLEFDEMMQSYQGKAAGQFDALILLSGGKDSAFLLYEFKRLYPKLRLLAATVDNGFSSPVALNNVSELVRHFGVDHFFIRPNASLYQTTYSFALTHLGDKGGSEVVDMMHGDLVHDIGRNLAAQLKIPLLISGVSWTQAELVLNVYSFEMPREIELQRREASAGFKLNEIYDKQQLNYWWDPNRYAEENVARVILPFYVWRYDEQEIRKKVKDLGLIKRGHDSPLVTNDALIPVINLVDCWRKGYSSFEPEFARMVRLGKTDKKLWQNIFEMLEYSAKTGWMIEKDVVATLKDLGLTKDDVLDE